MFFFTLFCLFIDIKSRVGISLGLSSVFTKFSLSFGHYSNDIRENNIFQVKLIQRISIVDFKIDYCITD